jgi:hypothetical protein
MFCLTSLRNVSNRALIMTAEQLFVGCRARLKFKERFPQLLITHQPAERGFVPFTPLRMMAGLMPQVVI